MEPDEAARRSLPPSSRWKLLGGWYDHIEWSDRESYHYVYEASDEVSGDELTQLVLYNMDDCGVVDDRALAEPVAVGGYVFPAASARRRCVGDEAQWREVVYDEKQHLILVVEGVDD